MNHEFTAQKLPKKFFWGIVCIRNRFKVYNYDNQLISKVIFQVLRVHVTKKW